MPATQRPPPGPHRPGPVYDDAMKFLADDDLGALLSVVGVTEPARRLNVELTAGTIKADLLAHTSTGIVHVEFVKDHMPDFALRMLDYRLRLRRRNPATPIAQFVLVLRDIPVPTGYTDLDPAGPNCTWTVVPVTDLDPAALLRSPTTAAIAALARGSETERAAVLTAAAELITTRTRDGRRDDLLGATATLASIVLLPSTIISTFKEASMPVLIRDTPLGRELYELARAEGLQEGRQEGRQEGARRLTRLMLRHRFGDDARIDSIAARLAELTDEQILARLEAAGGLDDLDR